MGVRDPTEQSGHAVSRVGRPVANHPEGERPWNRLLLCENASVPDGDQGNLRPPNTSGRYRGQMWVNRGVLTAGQLGRSRLDPAE